MDLDAALLRVWDRLTELQRYVVSQHRREGKPFSLIASESKRATGTVSDAWYGALKKAKRA